jgi:hypothetical protein
MGIMKIHGLRVYPHSVNVFRGEGAPIFIHGRISNDRSNFFYIFHPLAALWHGHFFANDFGVSYDEDGSLEDPIPHLRERFGSSLLETDLDSQLMLLSGDGFASWAQALPYEGALLFVFRELPSFDLLKRLYWSRDFRLTSDTWPPQIRSVLHMWDDTYWQLFSTDRSDLDILIRAHTGNPKLKMYYVDFDREYPFPSNQELQPVVLSK